MKSKSSKMAALGLSLACATSAANADTSRIFNVAGSFADEGVNLAPAPIPLSGTLTV